MDDSSQAVVKEQGYPVEGPASKVHLFRSREATGSFIAMSSFKIREKGSAVFVHFSYI